MTIEGQILSAAAKRRIFLLSRAVASSLSHMVSPAFVWIQRVRIGVGGAPRPRHGLTSGAVSLECRYRAVHQGPHRGRHGGYVGAALGDGERFGALDANAAEISRFG